MRTKSSGGIVTATYPNCGEQIYRFDTATQDWVPYGSFTRYTNTIRNGGLKTIVYDDTKRTGKLKRTRYCLHTIVEHKSQIESHAYYTSSAGTYLKRYTAGSAYSSDSLTIPDLSSLHKEAFDFFQSGCVENHFDLAADLIEWRQVSNLLPGLKKSFSTLLKFKNFKGTIKEFANLHLSYSFGIKPLVSDLKDLHESLVALTDKIAWLRKNQGKPVKVRFSKDLSKVYRPSDSVSTGSATRIVDTVSDYRCKYVAFALVKYDVSKLSDLELKLRTLFRNFGLDKPLSTLWELTPWSFVVDWVIKVGDFLESVMPTITLPITFLDLGHSIKISETRDLTWVSLYPYKGDTHQHVCVRRRSLYQRMPGLPLSLSIATGTPGANQLALSLSLAIQKWK